MKKFLLIVLTAFTLNAAAITIYYGPAGNDGTGNGTIGNPYATLTKAASVASSGDVCYQLTGTVTESSTVTIPVGVSLDAADTTAVLKGTMTTQFVPIIQLHSAEGTNGNQYIRNLKFDGNNETTSWAISIRGRSNVEVYNCVFRNFQETGVNWSGRNDGVQSPPSIYATGNSFHDNIMTNCSTFPGDYGRGCFQFGGQDGMQIYNNYIKNDFRAAGTNGWPIKGCNDSYIKNCRIHHNTLLSAPFPYSTGNGTSSYWDFAIELFYNVGGNIIDSNNVNGSIDINHQSKGSSSYSVWIHHNTIGFSTVQTNTQSGIILEFDTENAIVEWNTIKNTSDGIIFSMRASNLISNTIVRNNHIYNLTDPLGNHYGYGIGAHDSGPASWTADSLYIYNNTVRCNTNSSLAPFYGINMSNHVGINKWYVKNNIFTGFQEATIWSGQYSNITNSAFEYNFFYDNVRDAPFTIWSGGVTLPGGNTVTNNTLATDALLISSEDTLSNSSPAIDAGVNVGITYAGSAPDIGYREKGLASGDITPPTITSTSPTSGATNISIGQTVVINFSEALDGATVTTGNFYIDGVTSSVNMVGNAVYINPVADLSYSTVHTVHVTTGVTDVAGNTLAAPLSYTFTTEAAPVANDVLKTAGFFSIF